MVFACPFSEFRIDLVSNGELLKVIEHGNATMNVDFRNAALKRGEER